MSEPRTQISDELSSTLNNLQGELESSDLFDDVPSCRGVMRRAIPQTLVNEVGFDTVLNTLPEASQRALFSSCVVSHFIYKYGVNGSSVDFFHPYHKLFGHRVILSKWTTNHAQDFLQGVVRELKACADMNTQAAICSHEVFDHVDCGSA
ncbi:hypothetical protein NP233_g10979 [Leucocoprinus birnbaumii]|uniref:Uncharacterized protein n=1 Tax=Leucocoprinus birnbaumii TaxID=56174 RepID=A0AAD5YKU3_9AGAR|nr:hypothetical protein NP233_g10979 [Leucocoprinus birnbaumii]